MEALLTTKNQQRTLWKIFRVFLFFLPFFLLLPIQDGKQEVIDIVGAAMVIGVSTVVFLYVKKRREPSPLIVSFWILLLLYLAVRTVYSDDIGYSLYETARFVGAWLVFSICYSYSNRDTAGILSDGILVLCTIGLALAAADKFFLELNFAAGSVIGSSYGHNHIADIMLAAIPIAVLGFVQTKRKLLLLLLALFCIGILLSEARVVALLTAGYLGVVAARRLLPKFLNIILGFMVLVLLLWSVITLVYTPLLQSTAIQTTAEHIGQWKKSLFADGRPGYWTQAIEAIRDHPLVGSGPGTFYLQSLLRQKNPQANSWYAHSFPLQLLADTGVVGFLLVFSVVGWALMLPRRYITNRSALTAPDHSRRAAGLVHGAGLLLVYGLVDYSFDFLIIWLLFWAMLGVGAASAHADATRGRVVSSRVVPTAVAAAFAFLLMFYGISVVNLFLTDNAWRNPSAFYIPWRADDAELILSAAGKDNLVLSQAQTDLITVLHKRNPRVALALANYYQDREDPRITIRAYQFAIDLDRKNEQTHKDYVAFLMHKSLYDQLSEWFYLYSVLFLPRMPGLSLDAIRLTPDEMHALKDDVDVLFDGSMIHEVRFAKTYYKAGLLSVGVDNARAVRLWTASSLLDPSLSYYYVELASLAHYQLHDDTTARITLQKCMEVMVAARHCRSITTRSLPLPGSLEQDIESFPPPPTAQ